MVLYILHRTIVIFTANSWKEAICLPILQLDITFLEQQSQRFGRTHYTLKNTEDLQGAFVYEGCIYQYHTWSKNLEII